MEFPVTHAVVAESSAKLPRSWWATIAEVADECAQEAQAEGRTHDADCWRTAAREFQGAADGR